MSEGGDKTSWRDAVRARTAPKAQPVAVLSGWRRLVRPIGVVAVAAAVGAGSAMWMNDQDSRPAATPPAGSEGNPTLVNSRTIAVVATARRGCVVERGTYASGRLVVSVTNKDAVGLGAVSMRSGDEVLAERENIPPGATGTFVVTVPAGRYTIACPGTDVDRTPVTITGSSAGVAAAGSELRTLLTRASTTYGRYISDQAAGFRRASEDLSAALAGDQQRAAMLAYCRTKIYIKRIVDNPGVEGALESSGLEIEDQLEDMQKGLFKDGKVRSLTTSGDKLISSARRMETVVGGVAFDPNDIGLGALEMLNGVFRAEILGHEEEWSGYDMLDVEARVQGAKAAYTALRPALARVDGQFTTYLDNAFARLQSTISTFRAPSELGGFEHYKRISVTGLKNLSHDVQAVVEPVSRMTMKVVSG